ncbi:hypothetical protein KAW18_01030 [candidate division WOR-3 bacterium]|nr:hypothetical protein [candidate division WOR-3 bacterium]
MIQNLKIKLLEIGKIKAGKLGQERRTKDGKSTYRLPTKSDHFTITSTQRDETGNFAPDVELMKQIAEVVGEPWDHLVTLPVYLIFNTIEENIYTTYACYKGRTRICTGDGVIATDLTTGEQVQCPCPRLDQDYKGPAKCKIYGRLSVVLANMNIVGGAWVYRTTSFNSVQDILGSLMLIQKIAGRLSGIPLMLKLFPKTVQLPTGQATVYTASLIYQGSPFALAETAKKCLMLEHVESIAPDQTIETEEEAEIQEEFYPPETETERAKADAAAVTEKTRETRKETKKPAEEQKTEGQEPTAAELARADADKLKKKQEKVKAAAAAKKEKARIKKEKEEAKAAAANEDASEGQKTEDTSGETSPSGEEPPIEDGEVLDGPPEDFGWV